MSEFLKIEEGKTYFITFTAVDWLDVFIRDEYISILIDSIRYCQQHKGLLLYAYCIMPSHVHMIAGAKENRLGDLLRDMKGFTARKLLKEIKENIRESKREILLASFSKAGKKVGQEMQFWQHENYPIELYSDKFISQKENYIHQNPVEMGLVSRPEYYRLSSASEDSPLKVLPLK